MKEILVEAGLGEKKLEVDENLSAHEFQQKIIEGFPKLEGAGGFDLMRCIANSRQLEPISLAVAKSPKLLRKVIGSSRIYIRPIQRNLDTTPADDGMPLSSSPEVCTIIACIHVQTTCYVCMVIMCYNFVGMTYFSDYTFLIIIIIDEREVPDMWTFICC